MVRSQPTNVNDITVFNTVETLTGHTPFTLLDDNSRGESLKLSGKSFVMSYRGGGCVTIMRSEFTEGRTRMAIGCKFGRGEVGKGIAETHGCKSLWAGRSWGLPHITRFFPVGPRRRARGTMRDCRFLVENCHCSACEPISLIAF